MTGARTSYRPSNSRLRRCARCDAPVELATLAQSGREIELEPRKLGDCGGNLEVVQVSDDGEMIVRLVDEEHRRAIGAVGRARLRAPHLRTCPYQDRETRQ
jgi:hypothetical protein